MEESGTGGGGKKSGREGGLSQDILYERRINKKKKGKQIKSKFDIEKNLKEFIKFILKGFIVGFL